MRLRFKLTAAPAAYALSQLPGAREAHEALHRALWAPDSALPDRTKELAFLRLSQLNACDVCAASHTASAGRAGVSETEIAAVSRPEDWPSVFGDAEQAVLELATAMAGPPAPLSERLVERLRAAFDERQLAELVTVAGEASFNNRVSMAAKQVLRGGAEGAAPPRQNTV